MKTDRLLRNIRPIRETDVGLIENIRLELSRLRLLCRAWSEGITEAHRGDLAAAFTRRALEALAREVAPALHLSAAAPGTHPRLDEAAEHLALSFGRGAANLPLAEGLYLTTSLYPALLTERRRSALGAYYTPPVLTDRLLDQVTEEGADWRTARILDPAAGAGAFIVPAAMRMRKAMADCEPAFVLSQIGARLLGFELDPNAADLAQVSLRIALAELSTKSGRPVPQVIRVCDTLEEGPEERFDLVIGNPPYGRVTLSADQRGRYARSLYGHANLYGVFTDVALRWTKPAGMVAYLTPASFLSGQYYSALRGLLAREAPPVAIDLVHARRGVFEDVLQETLLAVYRKGEVRDRRAQIHYLRVKNEREACIVRNGTVGLPPDPAAPWLVPRTPEHSALIARVETMSARLVDWGYSVSTGPLVWNRYKPQLCDTLDGNGVHPLIWAESVTADGRFVFRAHKKNHAPYFMLKPGDAWLVVEEPCVLVQRTTAKEQARRLIAAELPAEFVGRHGGVVVENHLNMVRAEGVAKVPPGVVASLLNSRVADEVFRCMNGSVAVSAFELEALPLPHIKDVKPLERLVAEGAQRALVEAECDRLYRGAM